MKGAEKLQSKQDGGARRWREAVAHYTIALQNSQLIPFATPLASAIGSSKHKPKRFPDDFEPKEIWELSLRKKIIALAQKIHPPLAIPTEALRHLTQGSSIARAKTTREIAEARQEFEQAVKLAPWWADASYNLGAAQEILGLDAEAIRDFKLYLLAAPEAEDAVFVRARISKLEYPAK